MTIRDNQYFALEDIMVRTYIGITAAATALAAGGVAASAPGHTVISPRTVLSAAAPTGSSGASNDPGGDAVVQRPQ
ncbi:MAG TPA: hypothetical protein VGX23_25925 [Actinocrinis sp.]|nr:hypothetical protein [Actinocrinis sp.]